MTIEIGTPSVICSCSRVIHEMDALYCHGCGDVSCYDCTTECIHCSLSFCSHCSENEAECIRCYLKHNHVDKAFLVIGKEKLPIKNSQFMIKQTSDPYARDIILKFNNKEYKYKYRTICLRQGTHNVYDYFMNFEEVVTNNFYDESYQRLMEKYEDEYENSGLAPLDYYEEENYMDYNLSGLARSLPWFNNKIPY